MSVGGMEVDVEDEVRLDDVDVESNVRSILVKYSSTQLYRSDLSVVSQYLTRPLPRFAVLWLR